MFLEINQLQHLYDEKNGVREFSLSIEKAEFVTILGPSGCGKTTVLRMLGGFLRPQRGQVVLDGQDITHKDPEERPVSTIFQNYALFTHMTVLENICFGLENYRKLSKANAVEAAQQYIKLVGLAGYEKTNVQKLSGGQQQRVAIARSLAIEPKLLLLDEPFSNLDAALRERVRQDLITLQKQLHITMIFVTHDQEEALSLSDRIVVMDQGEIRQIGQPTEIYRQPQNAFVRDFLGGVEPHFALRSEDLEILPGSQGEVVEKSFLGATTAYIVAWKGERIRVTTLGSEPGFDLGDKVDIRAKSSAH